MSPTTRETRGTLPTHRPASTGQAMGADYDQAALARPPVGSAAQMAASGKSKSPRLPMAHSLTDPSRDLFSTEGIAATDFGVPASAPSAVPTPTDGIALAGDFHDGGHQPSGSLGQLHMRMRATSPAQVRPVTQRELRRAAQHYNATGCPLCQAYVVGAWGGAKAERVNARRRQEQARSAATQATQADTAAAEQRAVVAAGEAAVAALPTLAGELYDGYLSRAAQVRATAERLERERLHAARRG